MHLSLDKSMRILAPVVELLLLVAFYTNFSSCSSPRNIAEGRPCTVSPSPSYPLTALPSQISVLTDGRYTRGKFWTQRSTVGWFEPGNVKITIDLGAAYSVGSISFSTARGEAADVRYPEHVYAFLGHDLDHLAYAGDIMPRELLHGGYETRLFTLDAVNLRGRYVLLVAYPDGPYLFCDEIVVNEGAVGHEPDSTTTAAGALAYAERSPKSLHPCLDAPPTGRSGVYPDSATEKSRCISGCPRTDQFGRWSTGHAREPGRHAPYATCH